MRLSRLVARRGRRRRQTARCPLVCSEIAHGVSASDPASDEGAPLLLPGQAHRRGARILDKASVRRAPDGAWQPGQERDEKRGQPTVGCQNRDARSAVLGTVLRWCTCPNLIAQGGAHSEKKCTTNALKTRKGGARSEKKCTTFERCAPPKCTTLPARNCLECALLLPPWCTSEGCMLCLLRARAHA